MRRAEKIGLCCGLGTVLALAAACGNDAGEGAGFGGSSSGGSSSGGTSSGGSQSGGSSGSGGASSGSGGASAGAGGANSGGASTGGSMSGGAASGGSGGVAGASNGGASGGASRGGETAGGSGGTSSNSGGAAGKSGTGGSTTGGTATGGSGGSATGCLDFKAPTQVGTIESKSLAGPSGLVASRAHPGVLYGNLDAGGPATIFAMTTSGKSLGEYALTGAKMTDWEDLAVGKGPGTGSYIYVGDFGDNSSARTEIQVLRAPEPDVTPTQAFTQMAISDWQPLRFTYPDGAHDAETLMIDPMTGDILIVTKVSDGNSTVFRAAGTTPADAPTVLENVGNARIGTSGRGAQASAGDISPLGDRIAIRSYTTVLVWPRAASWMATFAAMPNTLAWSTEPQGEGLTFAADGASLFLAGEQAQPVYQALASCP